MSRTRPSSPRRQIGELEHLVNIRMQVAGFRSPLAHFPIRKLLASGADDMPKSPYGRTLQARSDLILGILQRDRMPAVLTKAVREQHAEELDNLGGLTPQARIELAASIEELDIALANPRDLATADSSTIEL